MGIVAAKWVLIVTLHFNTGGNEFITDKFNTRDNCVQAAKILWQMYYDNPNTNYSGMDAFCTNKNNHYEFIKITCDKNMTCHEQ